MIYKGLGEMFEVDFADMCADVNSMSNTVKHAQTVREDSHLKTLATSNTTNLIWLTIQFNSILDCPYSQRNSDIIDRVCWCVQLNIKIKHTGQSLQIYFIQHIIMLVWSWLSQTVCKCSWETTRHAAFLSQYKKLHVVFSFSFSKILSSLTFQN